MQLIFKNIYKKDIFIIIALYSLAYGLILLNKGIFWDDWVMYGVDKEFVIDRFRQTGSILVGYFHSFLLSFENGVVFYRVLVFLAYLLSGLFLNSILKTIKEINDTSRLFIVLFFVLFPVNSARIALINVPYAVCHFMFFLGFWLISEYIKNKKIIYKIISIPLFMLSFLTNSLLLYYFFTVFLYILYCERKNINSIKSTSQICLRYLDLFFLPFVFWIIKKLFFMPYGLYESYNTIKIQNISAINMIDSFKYSFLDVFKESFSLFLNLRLPALIFSFFLFLFLKNRIIMPKKNKNDLIFIFYGFALFIVGVFPYLVIGQVPSLFGWSSRHQLLVSLGSAFIIFYSLKIFLNKLNVNNEIKLFIYSLIVVSFVMCNYVSYLDYQRDWYKQLSLIENIKESKIIKDNTTFLFNDQAHKLNAKSRSYRFYEYSGIMKYAFGEETRFGVDTSGFNRRGPQFDYRKYFSALYNMKDYKQREPQYKIIIDYGGYSLTKKKVLRFILCSFINPNKFDENIKQIICLKHIKL